MQNLLFTLVVIAGVALFASAGVIFYREGDVGLGLFRQLPAGVPGAYRLLANLVSRPRAAAATPR